MFHIRVSPDAIGDGAVPHVFARMIGASVQVDRLDASTHATVNGELVEVGAEDVTIETLDGERCVLAQTERMIVTYL